MQLHQLKRTHKTKISRRVGRGGKRGSYSGHGLKGQSSRAGHKMQPAIREIIKKFPKLKGYRTWRAVEGITPVNVELLEKKFQAGEIVSPKILLQKHIVRRIKGRMPIVKILGKGEIGKKLTVINCLISKEAKTKIEKAGGVVKNY